MNIALKYRPSSFKDLIGQDVLVRILKNAFALNKIPQSVLLSGNSGVGKTTTARIISLCLNCSLGPTFNPCETCQSCTMIKNSSHPDVIEIDAASHTSIDDIKVILGDVCYSPINSKFKVYIIDEVHMLSNSAFNALLKTLEEPPSNVKFIFATTEIKKIPATIIARCQRFDLHNIPASKIIERLDSIVVQENYSIEKTALELIAHHSGNSMRNALFLLDQSVLYTKNNMISALDVMGVLGLVDRSIIFNLLEAILDGDVYKALILFDKGNSVANSLGILEDLLQVIQLICRFLISHEINNVTIEYERDRIEELSKRKSLIFFSRLWKALLNSIHDIRTSMCSNIAAEMVLISLCYLSDLPSPAQLVKKVLSQTTQVKCEEKQQNSNFCRILEILKQNNQIDLYKQLHNGIKLISCKPGYLKLKAVSKLDGNFCNSLQACLSKLTAQKWVVIVDPYDINNSLGNTPAVQNIINTFQGAKIVSIENKE